MATPQKIQCKVENIIAYGDGVYSLELTPERMIPIFKPGQFLQLAIDPYDPSSFWPESRAFSISSSPENRNILSITYSVRGKFTSRMEKEIKIGETVWVKLPFGEFIVNPSKPVVLIAGGTGITAFTAFLNHLSSTADQPITLLYGARNQRLLIFKKVADQCKHRKPDFLVFYFVESPDGKKHGMLEGRVDVDLVWPEIPHNGNEEYYLSGPPPMLKLLFGQLTALGITPNRIHIDSWE